MADSIIGNLKPYPTMKDSGVEWLGEVPEHWEVTKLGQMGRLSKGSGGNKEDEVPVGVPCIRYGDLYTTHTYVIRDSRSCIPDEKATSYTPIRFGDVLFAASGETIEEIGKSAVNLIQSEAYCGGDVILFRPKRRVEARYMGYATDCRPVTIQKARMGRGITISHIYGQQLKQLTLPLPLLPEQAAIAGFLDHADQRIRRYIVAKQKLIALLEEHKRLLIHEAVTGQIDVRTGEPYPTYKDSGMESLGEVPEHWEAKRLYRCGTIAGGMTPSMENSEFWNGTIPWVKPRDMKQESICESSVKVSEVAVHETSLRMIDPPAVLMVVRGMILARRVPIAWITGPVTINQDMKALVPAPEIQAEFLARALDSAQGAFVSLIDEAGHGTRRLPTERWRALAVAFPPEDEQVLIVDSLRRATQTIVAVIDSAHRQVSLLEEYRTRLFAEVVTGKLDVRDLAASLPKEADERGPADGEDPLAGGHRDSL